MSRASGPRYMVIPLDLIADLGALRWSPTNRAPEAVAYAWVRRQAQDGSPPSIRQVAAYSGHGTTWSTRIRARALADFQSWDVEGASLVAPEGPRYQTRQQRDSDATLARQSDAMVTDTSEASRDTRATPARHPRDDRARSFTLHIQEQEHARTPEPQPEPQPAPAPSASPDGSATHLEAAWPASESRTTPTIGETSSSDTTEKPTDSPDGNGSSSSTTTPTQAQIPLLPQSPTTSKTTGSETPDPSPTKPAWRQAFDLLAALHVAHGGPLRSAASWEKPIRAALKLGHSPEDLAAGYRHLLTSPDTLWWRQHRGGAQLLGSYLRTGGDKSAQLASWVEAGLATAPAPAQLSDGWDLVLAVADGLAPATSLPQAVRDALEALDLGGAFGAVRAVKAASEPERAKLRDAFRRAA